MSEQKCLDCGEVLADHHEFRSRLMPEFCQCQGRDWDRGSRIPAVCKDFAPGEWGNCDTCEHEDDCHAARQADSR